MSQTFQSEPLFQRFMPRAGKRVCAVLVLWLSLAAAAHLAAQTPDRTAFDAAVRAFETGLWERAATEFAAVEATYPDSPLKPEAARRRLYAEAETKFAAGDFAAAAKGYADYQSQHADTPRAPLAAVRQAEAELKQNQAAAALAVLGEAGRPFAKALAAGVSPPVLFRGLLVKAEALTVENNLEAAAMALEDAARFAESPEERWERLSRLAGIREQMARPEAALEAAAALLTLANAEAALAERRPSAASQAARLYLRLGQPAKAAEALAQNTAAGVPVEFLREAVLQLAELEFAQGNLGPARQRLEAFVAAQPQDAGTPAARLLLGRILFRQYQAARTATGDAAAANALLTLAAGQFSAGLTKPPAPELAGPMHLGLGWCQWEDGVGVNSAERIRAAETNFQAATVLLPRGADQAVARFKWADCLFSRGEAAGAATNYLQVATGYADVAEARSLVEPALHQTVIAATEAGDATSAKVALEQLLARNPHGEPAAGSALLVGQSLARAGKADDAATLLADYLAKFPDSPLVPEVRLGLVAAKLRGGRWNDAVTELDSWVAAYTNHPSLPRAEFDRWWASTQAGLATNAVQQVAELAARYPTNQMVLTAQLWLAGHFHNLGDFARAEQACVNVVTNTLWKGRPEWYQARLWAAESARRRGAWGNATNHLFDLLNDQTIPANVVERVVPSAYFSLGELLLVQPAATNAAPLAGFALALDAFRAAAGFTNSPLAPAATGKMADCHLQLASQNTNAYARAAELYLRARDWPGAGVDIRSQASVGLGVVAEKLAALSPGPEAAARLKEALNHYLDVAQGKLLRPGEGGDPWWLKEAGREAGRLLEQTGRWSEAAALYDQLGRELPALKPVWDTRAAEARRRAVN